MRAQTVPIAYTVGRYGADGLVVTIRDVTARIASQHDREILLQAAARTDEQVTMLRALGGSSALPPTPEVELDSWRPAEDRGGSSNGLTSLTPLPDGRCLLLMVNGDGQGYESARDAWKALYVARTHVAGGAPLAEMISRASDGLGGRGEPSLTASVVGVIIDPVTGYLQVASGGHPPPLLVKADGSSQWIDAVGRPLGDEHPGSVRLASAVLGSGDSLLVYGIGIIDGTRDVVEGMSALRSAAIALRGTPMEGAAERIGLAAVPPGETREQADILLVVRLAASRSRPT